VSEPGERARLFVALPVPPQVASVLARLRPLPEDGVRPVADADLHITVHFLGDFEIGPVSRALASVAASGFGVRFDAPGLFSLRNRRKVLWLGVEMSEPLLDLHRMIATALEPVGFRPEQRPYRPHLTLARLSPKAPPKLLEAVADTILPARGAGFRCHEFALYSSETRSDGARYAIIDRFALTD